MGTIRAASSGQTQILEPEHLVGRARICALQLIETYVSAQHALLRWNEGWRLKDLGSRNGTFHDGHRLKRGEERAVADGAKIAFGKLEQEWVLVDDAPPRVMAVPVAGGDPVLLERDLLALPSDEDPLATIYRAEGAWILERADGSTAPLSGAREFDVAGRIWRFCCPENAAATFLDAPRLEHGVGGLRLLFAVSLDEEHVELRMVRGATTVDLGARNHNYLLLTLARRRAADAARGLPPDDCGWVDLDELARDPAMAGSQLNIGVFRIRKLFAAAGVPDAAAIVERRARTRKLRIGTAHITVAVL